MSLAIAALPGPASVRAASTTVTTGRDARIHLQLRSFKERRDDTIVKQAFDYSCGAAALATLLTYAQGDPVGEVEVLRAVLDTLSADETSGRKKEGLSLFDLQRVAEARGYRAQGFRIDPAALPRISEPVMVFIKPRGYAHFAVFRGIRGDRVFLADPSRGNIRMSIDAFLDSWLDDTGKGIVFVVEPADGRRRHGPMRFESGVGEPRPEILGARQMLEVGDPHVRFPTLAR
jgi:hypothetical protein